METINKETMLDTLIGQPLEKYAKRGLSAAIPGLAKLLAGFGARVPKVGAKFPRLAKAWAGRGKIVKPLVYTGIGTGILADVFPRRWGDAKTAKMGRAEHARLYREGFDIDPDYYKAVADAERQGYINQALPRLPTFNQFLRQEGPGVITRPGETSPGRYAAEMAAGLV